MNWRLAGRIAVVAIGAVIGAVIFGAMLALLIAFGLNGGIWNG